MSVCISVYVSLCEYVCECVCVCVCACSCMCSGEREVLDKACPLAESVLFLFEMALCSVGQRAG